MVSLYFAYSSSDGHTSPHSSRTAVNVSGDLTASVVMEKWLSGNIDAGHAEAEAPA